MDIRFESSKFESLARLYLYAPRSPKLQLHEQSLDSSIMSIDFPKEEEAVLRRWKEIKAFETQVELSKEKKPYVFYDGPPFATVSQNYK